LAVIQPSLEVVFLVGGLLEVLLLYRVVAVVRVALLLSITKELLK
jgi:hypothetical protein